MELIVILDFGSQYSQLIARRIREMGVFTEIVSPSIPLETLFKKKPKGVILSGGPESTKAGGLRCDPALFETKIPVLGICYGMQLMNVSMKGTVSSHSQGEYGKQTINLSLQSQLFKNLEKEETVWMSHGDSIDTLASCYQVVAKSKSGVAAAIQHHTLPHYGVQFHPEVTHTKRGSLLLENFLQLSGCSKTWTIENYIEEITQHIQNTVKDGRVISLVSGGVDSTAATFLAFHALGDDKVIPIHIDTGLMREGESREVKSLLKKHGMRGLVYVDAKTQFLNVLKGVKDPEKKRHIIGDLFIKILESEIKKLEHTHTKTFLCQGTLYTDLIESGKGCGNNAAVIKSHHNVNPPIIQKKRAEGQLIEPNAKIFKDEVRKVCRALNIPNALIHRHPFPGPGLAIRILGEVTEKRLQILRKADSIFLEEIRQADLYDHIWQAFAVLLPVSTVGVMGDKRTTGVVVCLRAVSSVDGMTADFSSIPFEVLGQTATRIVNEIAEVNRVVYDITSKPPATIEWE